VTDSARPEDAFFRATFAESGPTARPLVRATRHVTIASQLQSIVGAEWVRTDPASLDRYGQDALEQVHRPDAVALPANTAQVAAIARLCDGTRTPLVPRGAGTGYSGGAVPLAGGVVVSLERLDRILQIDVDNLLTIVQPNVITGELQAEVEKVGLFYPPDPSSLDRSAIGGNIAECAGGPRAFKYGTTRRYVLALEAVLPTGEIIRTGSHAVKNVVGYDLTQLLVGSEGTLAIVTEATLRLVPKPPAQATVRATFATVRAAALAVGALLRARVVPATLELVDDATLEAAAAYTGEPFAPAGTGAMLLIDCDGTPAAVEEDIARVAAACQEAQATSIDRARTEGHREALWRIRRELSPALKTIARGKLNNDIVVPRGRIPELFDLVGELRQASRLPIPCFGHAGDGNIHVNVMFDPADADQRARATAAVDRLFRGVVSLGGSITGEHGVGYTKSPYLGYELSPEVIALMRRVKSVFDPNGILNPGKIFAAPAVCSTPKP